MLDIVTKDFCELLAQEYEADRKAGLSRDAALRDLTNRFCSNRKLVRDIVLSMGCDLDAPVLVAAE